MSNKKSWVKERLFQEKNKDSNIKLWRNIWITITIMAFFTGWGVAGAYYTIEMNKEVQYAIDTLVKEHHIEVDNLPIDMQIMFAKYDVNGSRNHTGEKHVMKLTKCNYEGCEEIR